MSEAKSKILSGVAETLLIRHRPFRASHRTISHAGLVGGGNIPHPGEISLVHRGVLFLDEFPEFSDRALEVMHQPMEEKVVTISRAKGSLTFPANFMLVAAMNPCPCGYYDDSQKPWTCAHAVVTKRQKRISGPMLDRKVPHVFSGIDIHVEVPRVGYEKLSSLSSARWNWGSISSTSPMCIQMGWAGPWPAVRCVILPCEMRWSFGGGSNCFSM